jgi:hypothetical protein
VTWAIFSSRQAAEAFAAEVDEVCGYPRSGSPLADYPLGWTLRHATVVVGPYGEAAYSLDGVPESVELPAGVELVEALPWGDQ